jgi:hypothetical protein
MGLTLCPSYPQATQGGQPARSPFPGIHWERSSTVLGAYFRPGLALQGTAPIPGCYVGTQPGVPRLGHGQCTPRLGGPARSRNGSQNGPASGTAYRMPPRDPEFQRPTLAGLLNRGPARGQPRGRRISSGPPRGVRPGWGHRRRGSYLCRCYRGSPAAAPPPPARRTAAHTGTAGGAHGAGQTGPRRTAPAPAPPGLLCRPPRMGS